ncbi:interleukin-21 receptor-like [Synchiropus picturatus]
MKSLQYFISCLAGLHLVMKTSCINKDHSFTVDGFACVSSYWDTVSCVLNITHNNEIGFTLRFSQEERNQSCPLVPVGQSFHAVCQLELDVPTFMSIDIYDIDLCFNFICTSVVKQFKPSWNLQLTPPEVLVVHHAPDNITLMWKSGYEDHKYLNDALRYEIQIQQRASSQTKTWTVTPTAEETKRKMQSVELPDPESDAQGCVKVRSNTREGTSDFKATWSLWSPEVCKEIKGRPGQQNLLTHLGIISAFGGLVLVIFSCATFKKILRLPFYRTPSPAPYFQSLFQQHDGNLLEWLSPHGNLANTIEEIVVMSRVIVEAKPITRDLRHHASLPQTPVVSSQKLSCQLNPLYTLPPCGPDEFREDEGIATEDFVIITRQDSGCSSEGLVESLESSLERQFPCCITDYCTLNQRGEVVMPVLVSSSPHSSRSDLDLEV